MHLPNWLLTLLLVLTGLMVVRWVALRRKPQSASSRLPNRSKHERFARSGQEHGAGDAGATLVVEASMLGEHLRPSALTVLPDPGAVEALVRAGDFASAMTAYREQTGTSKLEARLAVERIRARVGR
jgi:microcystin degradation protein MlrC